MTNKEFYTALTNIDTLPTELHDYAVAAIEKIDAANLKRKNAPKKVNPETAALYDRIVGEVLGTEPMTASDVAAVLECSTQKASGLLRQLGIQGRVTVGEQKVPKKGTVKVYSINA